MKLCNIVIDGQIKLAIATDYGIIDVSETGLSMDEIIAGADASMLKDIKGEPVSRPQFADVVDTAGKLLCVGLNYRQHAINTNMPIPEYPVLFSKFANALAPSGSEVELPEWEDSYDYEAELVIVIGETAWNVSAEEAKDCIFGYTCGNDVSCRDPQMRSAQWLIGKTMPGFGPCGPYIVTADEFDPASPHSIQSYVNGNLRQNSDVTDMIFSPAEVVSYASKYVRLEPGDLIFTGTPSGVALEGGENKFGWLKKGDTVEVRIDGIGSLFNKFV